MWTATILYALSRELGLRVAQEDRPDTLPDDLDSVDFMIHLNATQALLEQLAGQEYRGFHVIRDPRDILVSSYFSDRYSHPVYREEFAQFRERLEEVPLEDGMRLELNRRTGEFEALEGWNYDNPRVYETRYEDLTARPYDEFVKILGFLGIAMPESAVESAKIRANRALRRAGLSLHTRGIPPDFLRSVIDRQSFQKLSGRQKGQEDPKSHYRKGVAGDWVNYLTGENKELFKDRWGRLTMDLGYEKDLSW